MTSWPTVTQKQISHHSLRSSLIAAVPVAVLAWVFLVVGLPPFDVGIGVGAVLTLSVASSHETWLGALTAVAIMLLALVLGLADKTHNALVLVPRGFAFGVLVESFLVLRIPGGMTLRITVMQKQISHHPLRFLYYLERFSLIVAALGFVLFGVHPPAYGVGYGVGVTLAWVLVRSHMARVIVPIALAAGLLLGALGLAGGFYSAPALATAGAICGVFYGSYAIQRIGLGAK